MIQKAGMISMRNGSLENGGSAKVENKGYPQGWGAVLIKYRASLGQEAFRYTTRPDL
jgi:hypothetical protein